LADEYGHRVNACVPKPIDFSQFLKAIGQLASFWAAVDEPLPDETGNVESSTLIHWQGRTPNSGRKSYTL
jgi:hypothetical protein